MVKFIRTKNNKDLLTAVYSYSGTTSAAYADPQNISLTDTNGTTHTSIRSYNYYTSVQSAYNRMATMLTYLIEYGGSVFPISSTSNATFYFSLGYEAVEPTENAYIVDNILPSAGGISVSRPRNIPTKFIYTYTNTASSNVTINTLGIYMLFYDTAQSTYIRVLQGIIYFDDITLPEAGSITINVDIADNL